MEVLFHSLYEALKSIHRERRRLTPMALGIGRGSDLRAPLAIAVIGGLLVATALTLLLVPVIYQTVESVRLRAREAISGGSVDTAPDPATAPGD